MRNRVTNKHMKLFMRGAGAGAGATGRAQSSRPSVAARATFRVSIVYSSHGLTIVDLEYSLACRKKRGGEREGDIW